MSDKQAMQAAGGDGHKGEQHGIDHPSGKTGGGESGGGGYPNPQAGKKPKSGGFMGHGGQSHIDYSGTGDEDGEHNANAATGAE